jgi:signal transduction histidine kinase
MSRAALPATAAWTHSGVQSGSTVAWFAAADGAPRAQLDGCLDVDLESSAVTRLAGVRRRIDQVDLEEVVPSVTTDLAEAARHLDGTADDLAAIGAGLRPAELDEGLPPALAALAHRSPVPVTLDLQLRVPIPTEVATAAYYVAAEALTNVAKHARATAVHLTACILREDGADVLVVTVTDDGTGGVSPKEGGGIIGLADRAAALGGVVTARGSPGGGTVVEARLPIRPGPSAT